MNEVAQNVYLFGGRKWHPFWVWEDFQNGLFAGYVRQGKVDESKALLSSPDDLETAMLQIAQEWIHACEQNMSNPSRNKQAFLGQCACCKRFEATESEVRTAWRSLTEDQKNKANAVADKVINHWKNEQIL